jgi:hypothetical protein
MRSIPITAGQMLTNFSLKRVIIDLLNYQHNGQSSSLTYLTVCVTTEGGRDDDPGAGGARIMTGASLPSWEFADSLGLADY